MTYLGERIRKFIGEGRLVIGICNGFQTLVNTGLLPGFSGDYTKKEVALLHNDCGNFRDQWVDLLVEEESPCIFTKGMKHFSLPVRHGEGKFYAEPETLQRLEENKQVVLRYANEKGEASGNSFPQNPNGSLHDIAGI
ncbi:phosphoribosylformylglycinamidine synthase subunit PurQ, partial [Desulfococcaceae bacterium OttesenSCG-928-F15]|nr:phosphoribosylformylglycinamidine synthase subunit PurQ [Desulfococcaceae bacterium OttesenSCG-928-F15]